MARIRSVHPGLWTDENFFSLSISARLLFIGLWNEADDAGAIAFKPLTIKAKLYPADTIDVVPLLEELVRNRCLLKYKVGGKEYAAIRNFGKWQRPKKPNRTYPMTSEAIIFSSSQDIPCECAEDSDVDCQSDGTAEDSQFEEKNNEPEEHKTHLNCNEFSTSSEPVPNQYGNCSADGGDNKKEIIEGDIKELLRSSKSEPQSSDGGTGSASFPKPKRTRQQTSLAITEPIPDWMPVEAWNGYLEMRVKTRNKPTERAISLAIKKLDGFRQQGHSVEEVLNQSTFRNWTGLFPVKQGHARTQSNVYAFNRPKGHFETVEEISKADDIGTMDDLKAMDEIARQRGVRIGAWRH